ncbi:MAG: TIGR04388 family protein [bacterium]|nr:TIGR04388 family protein [bacterium]
MRGVILVLALAALADFSGPRVSLSAQPVPVPPLGTPTFQTTDFDPYFNSARGSQTQENWEVLIDQARILLGTQWETQVDAAIDAQVAAIGHSDFFHTPAEYRAYLRSELEIQKQSAYALWEAQADAQIEAQRVAFLSDQSDERARQTDESSEQAVETAEQAATPNSIEAAQRWEAAFGQQVQQGMADYSAAFAEADYEYETFQANIAARRADFERERQANEAREQIVRQGITTAVDQMQNYLDTNRLFYDEDCDDLNECTKVPDGVALQTLIDGIRTELTNDAPISTLVTLMNDYNEQSRTRAEDLRDQWSARISGTHTGDSNTSFTPWGQTWRSNHECGNPAVNRGCLFYATNNGLGVWIHEAGRVAPLFDWGGIMANPSLAAVINYRQDNSSQAARDFLANTFVHSAAQITAVHNMDLCGTTVPTINGAHHNEGQYCYSSRGNSAFLFEDRSSYYWRDRPRGQYHIRHEAHFRVSMSFDWYDPNADANYQQWESYLTEITDVADHWNNNLLPAIQTWESQVASFNAAHTAWQAEATLQEAQAEQDYNDHIASLSSERTKWLSGMQETYRDTAARWRNLSAEERAAAAAEQEANLQAASGTGSSASGTNSLSTLTSLQETAFLSNAAANFAKQDLSVPRPSVEAPDLRELLTDINRLGTGIRQSALAGAQDDYANRQQQSLIDNMRATLEAQYLGSDGAGGEIAGFEVAVGPNGAITATRQINSGRAIRTGGGNGTSMMDYSAEMTEQTLTIAPPPTMRLASTGSLFEHWDQGDFFDQLASNQNNYAQASGDAWSNFADQVGSAAEAADAARQNFIKFRENEIENAINMERQRQSDSRVGNFLTSIAGAMFSGGLSLDQAVTDHMQNQVSAHIAEATGIPSTFFNGVLDGQSWQSALTEATEYLVTDYVTNAVVDATGLPAGFVGGLAGPGGLDMSGEAMQASFQNYSEQIFAETLEEQTGVPGLGALVLSRHREHQAERERVDSERRALVSGNGLVMGAHLLRHTEAGRELTNSALGLLSGETFGNALGLPPTLLSPIGGPTTFLYGQLGCKPCAAGPGLMPRNADELWEMTDDFGDIASGRTDGRDLAEKYDERIERALAEDRAARENLGSMTLGDLPGFIGSGISNSLTGVMGAVMGPLTALTNPSDDLTPEEIMVRESLAAQIGEATGQNQAYLMAVARGEDYDDAVYAQVYDDAATAIYGDNIPPQLRDHVVGAVRDYTEHTLERLEFQRQRERAQNDPWNIWRNAEYGSEDQRMALRAVEVGAAVGITVATSGAAGPAAMAFMAGSAGTVITAGYIGYMAAKEGYLAYLRTGEKEAGYAGLVSGAANGALGYFTGGQANMSLTYSDEDGFGGSFGYGMNNDGFTAGGNISWQEGEGITGVGLNASIQQENSFAPDKGANLGLNFGPDGSFQGGNISATLSGNTEGDQNWNGSLGVNFGSDFSYAGASANVSISGSKQEDEKQKHTAYTLGGGLTINPDGTSSIDVTNSIALTNPFAPGLNGAGANVNTSFQLAANGSYVDSSQNISIDFKTKTKEQAKQAILAATERQTAREAELEAQIANATGEELAALAAELNRVKDSLEGLEILRRQADLPYARWKRALEILAARNDKEEYARLEADPSLLENDDYRDDIFEGGEGDLVNEGDGDTYANAFTQWLGSIGGEIAGLFGHNSDGHGWVDDKGVYHERTCFVAGTLVRVHPETRGAFEENGSWYKRIEEIEVGDVVLSWNEESGEISFQPVINQFVRRTEQIYIIEYADGTRIETTATHPFYIDNRGWVNAAELDARDRSHTVGSVATAFIDRSDTPGNSIVASSDLHHSARTIPIRATSIVRSRSTVYNFDVAVADTYFVSQRAILVHNGEYEELTEDIERFGIANASNQAARAEAHEAYREWLLHCTQTKCNEEEMREFSKARARILSYEYSVVEFNNLKAETEAELEFRKRGGDLLPKDSDVERLAQAGGYDTSERDIDFTTHMTVLETILKSVTSATGQDKNPIAIFIEMEMEVMKHTAGMSNDFRDTANHSTLYRVAEGLSPEQRLNFNKIMEQELGVTDALGNVSLNVVKHLDVTSASTEVTAARFENLTGRQNEILRNPGNLARILEKMAGAGLIENRLGSAHSEMNLIQGYYDYLNNANKGMRDLAYDRTRNSVNLRYSSDHRLYNSPNRAIEGDSDPDNDRIAGGSNTPASNRVSPQLPINRKHAYDATGRRVSLDRLAKVDLGNMNTLPSSSGLWRTDKGHTPSDKEIRAAQELFNSENRSIVFPRDDNQPGFDAFYRDTGQPIQFKQLSGSPSQRRDPTVAFRALKDRVNEAYRAAFVSETRQKNGIHKREAYLLTNIDLQISVNGTMTREDIESQWRPGRMAGAIRARKGDGVFQRIVVRDCSGCPPEGLVLEIPE